MILQKTFAKIIRLWIGFSLKSNKPYSREDDSKSIA